MPNKSLYFTASVTTVPSATEIGAQCITGSLQAPTRNRHKVTGMYLQTRCITVKTLDRLRFYHKAVKSISKVRNNVKHKAKYLYFKYS
jgi:hypothetical protein